MQVGALHLFRVRNNPSRVPSRSIAWVVTDRDGAQSTVPQLLPWVREAIGPHAAEEDVRRAADGIRLNGAHRKSGLAGRRIDFHRPAGDP